MNKGAFRSLLVIFFLAAISGAHAQHIPIPSGFQTWADANRNGTLEAQEVEKLVVAVIDLLSGPHEVRTGLDRMFDRNGDGTIGPGEFEFARGEFFLPQLIALGQSNPEAARQVDQNRDGRVDEREAQLALEYLFVNPEFRKPHPADSPLDQRMDRNNNRRVEEGEIVEFRMQVVRAVSLLPFSLEGRIAQSPAPGPERPGAGNGIPAVSPFEKLADTNDDSVVDAVEQKNREESLRGPHKTTTIFDKRVDSNGNGAVEKAEIEAVLKLPHNEEEGVGAVQTAEQGGLDVAAQAQEKPSVAAQAEPAAKPAASTAAAKTSTAAARTGDLELSSISFDDIFPVFHKYYDEHKIGTAKLKNAGAAAAEGIKIQLIVKGYMTDKKACKGPDSLAAGEEKDVELYALFSEKEVLAITEGTKALATVSVEYTTKGAAKSEEFTGTVRFLDRNAMTWDSEERAAAFVTAKDPWVLKLSKSVAGTIKGKASTAVDANLLTAIGIHKELALYGMSYVADPKSSYETITKTKNAVDSLQFPQQTLEYKSGDCDDLSILTCALLESVGVETAFVTIPGHIFIAFALSMKPDDARTSFLKPSELIFQNEKSWVPVEVTSISKGFLKAWEEGAKEWNENYARKQALLTPLQDAWKKYEPVAFSTGTLSLSLPADSALVKGYQEEVSSFINREIAERVITLQAEIKKNQEKPESVNKLGVLYAKHGLTDLAEKEFAKVLKKTEYVPAKSGLSCGRCDQGSEVLRTGAKGGRQKLHGAPLHCTCES
jgi:hypothetical protein